MEVWCSGDRIQPLPIRNGEINGRVRIESESRHIKGHPPVEDIVKKQIAEITQTVGAGRATFGPVVAICDWYIKLGRRFADHISEQSLCGQRITIYAAIARPVFKAVTNEDLPNSLPVGGLHNTYADFNLTLVNIEPDRNCAAH